MLLVWVPFRARSIGRAAYAVGSSEVAAYMSGVPIDRAKFVAYTLAGFFAAIGGLFLTFLTYSGEADMPQAGTYTLNSIAAVVLGGISLFGGTGSAIGAIFGALVFRTIGDLLFVFDVEPLLAAAVPGRRAAGRGQPRRAAAAARQQPAGAVRMSAMPIGACTAACAAIDRPIADRGAVIVCILLLLGIGSFYSHAASCRRTTCCSS